MFRVIKNEYGKELGLFEFDYLGEHPALDMVLLNAEIRLYEKGLQILTGLSNDSLFVNWHSVVSCTTNRYSMVNLTTNDGVIQLQKVKKETDIGKFSEILKSTIPEIVIKYVKSEPDNLRSIEMKRSEKLYDEQECRVNEFVKNCGGKNDSRIEDAWCKYLEENLQFPFEAEIIDEPGPLEVGDIIKVTGIDNINDLYGIVVNARKGRKKYPFPLCLLESVEKASRNHQLVDDYNLWFSNR